MKHFDRHARIKVFNPWWWFYVILTFVVLFLFTTNVARKPTTSVVG